VGGTWLSYNGELLAVLFAQMCYMAGTHGYKELHSYKSLDGTKDNEGLQLVINTSERP